MFRVLTPDGTEVATIEDNYPIPLRRTVELKQGHAEDTLVYQMDEAGRAVVSESGGLTLLHAPLSPNDITRVAYRLEPVPEHQVFDVVPELPTLESRPEDPGFINTEDANDPPSKYVEEIAEPTLIEDYSLEDELIDCDERVLDAEDSDVGGPRRNK